MKTYTLISALLLLAGSIFSQKTYKTSMSFTFSGGNNMGAAIGNDCGNKDIDIQFNSIDGNMEVTVNKVCHTWSFVQHWMGGSYAPSIVFKKRFLELRIQSSAAHESGLSIGFQTSGGNPDGTMGKSIPGINYGINEADTWETKFFNVGGTADTVFKEVDYFFPNGFYKLDYVYYGDAAEPPVPTITQVKDQVNSTYGSQEHSITLTGISIPGRLYDGLTIEAKAKNAGFFKNVYIEDLGGGVYIDEENQSAVLKYSVFEGSYRYDTIIVTLKDAIRGTLKTMSFRVEAAGCLCPDIALDNNLENSITVFPTVTTGYVTIESNKSIAGDIAVCDMYGNFIISQKINSIEKTDLNLEGLTAGLYFIKISDGKNVVTHKVVKE